MKLPTFVCLASVAACGLFTVTTLSAQDKPGKMNPDARIEKMKADLGLSDEQVTKIKAIHESKKSEIDAIREDKSLTPEERREKIKPIMDDVRKQTAEVLTPEQRAKMKAGGKKPKDMPQE